MNTTAAHLNHDTHAPGERTIREWADISGRVPASVMKTVRRKLDKGYSLESTMSADQFYGLFKKTANTVRHQNTDTQTPRHPNTQTPKSTNPQTPKKQQSSALPFQAYRRPILYTLMAMPAVASIQNMYSVTSDIAAHLFTAALLTGLFSVSPFLFVLAGVRSGWTKALAGAMIGYECFCNTTRIYGGLIGFEHGDFPTRFLGLVTDIFAYGKLYDKANHFIGYEYQAGTHETAVVLAAVMALMAAAIFYASFYELTRK